ncbi:hypothetical protein PVT67_17955 [Gallaecimonas kandeliae]|uniref:hypothetical protein n=1 Tax=Gallaecimonas kandeliae TaxID=3029055 RepID=UPI002647596F|nr:hypothetical protein [Gallaecimonas kandeliae]WKE65526.1 hypothetical protein PVT67_17955 [Gallaecimonas kandeliae]
MDKATKKQALLNYFSSFDYAQELVLDHDDLVRWLEKCIEDFRLRNPPELTNDWQVWETPDEWERRVLANFRGTNQRFHQALGLYRQGDRELMERVCSSILGLSKNMDVVSERWFKYVDNYKARKYAAAYNDVSEKAANIYYTLRGTWHDNEILDEVITGLINEAKLREYLPEKPPQS